MYRENMKTYEEMDKKKGKLKKMKKKSVIYLKEQWKYYRNTKRRLSSLI